MWLSNIMMCLIQYYRVQALQVLNILERRNKIDSLVVLLLTISINVQELQNILTIFKI